MSRGWLLVAVGLVLALAWGAPAALAQELEEIVIVEDVATEGEVEEYQDTGDEAGRILVALLPVVIHSLEDQSFLRLGLSDMLLSRLGREQRLAVVPIVDPAAATTDLEAARGQARAVGAAYVVYGSFTHFGKGASVDLSCALVDGDAHGPREVFVHAGALGDIIPTLDGLADRIARYVVEGPGPDSVARTASRGSGAGGGGSGDVPAELEDIVRRLEALERALDPELAVEEDTEVPGIFQVFPEDSESAPN